MQTPSPDKYSGSRFIKIAIYLDFLRRVYIKLSEDGPPPTITKLYCSSLYCIFYTLTSNILTNRIYLRIPSSNLTDHPHSPFEFVESGKEINNIPLRLNIREIYNLFFLKIKGKNIYLNELLMRINFCFLY